MISPLNRIMNWLQVNCSDYAESFLPGLFDRDIQAIEERLQLCLPESLHALYQWHNGTEESPNHRDAFVVFHFSPLEQMAEVYEDLYSADLDECLTLKDGRRMFPFSQYNDGFLAILIEDSVTPKAGQV
ncbi:SMI1/KNR4 family protein, partial [Phormidium sp. FACHB-592]